MTTTEQQFLAAFDETLRKSPAAGGWTYVVWPRLGGVLRHPRSGEGARHRRRPSRSRAPSWPSGDGTHKLPVKAAVRKEIGKAEGDTVHVVITERL